jgi:hypothetical protein
MEFASTPTSLFPDAYQSPRTSPASPWTSRASSPVGNRAGSPSSPVGSRSGSPASLRAGPRRAESPVGSRSGSPALTRPRQPDPIDGSLPLRWVQPIHRGPPVSTEIEQEEEEYKVCSRQTPPPPPASPGAPSCLAFCAHARHAHARHAHARHAHARHAHARARTSTYSHRLCRARSHSPIPPDPVVRTALGREAGAQGQAAAS